MADVKCVAIAPEHFPAVDGGGVQPIITGGAAESAPKPEPPLTPRILGVIGWAENKIEAATGDGWTNQNVGFRAEL